MFEWIKQPGEELKTEIQMSERFLEACVEYEIDVTDKKTSLRCRMADFDF